MEVADYVPLVHAGAEGLVVYQETYHRPTYANAPCPDPKELRLAAGLRRTAITRASGALASARSSGFGTGARKP